MRDLLSRVTALMRKWACTDHIWKRKPSATAPPKPPPSPVTFCLWRQDVRTTAGSFQFSHHLSTRSIFFFSPFFLGRMSPTLMWLKSSGVLCSNCPFRVMSTFSGMSTVCLLRMVFHSFSRCGRKCWFLLELNCYIQVTDGFKLRLLCL